MAKIKKNNDIEQENQKTLPEQKPQKKKKNWFLRLILFFFGFVFLLIFLLFVALNLPSTKDWIAKKGIEYLNQDFKTQISAEKIEIDFFGDVDIYGLKVKDYKGFDFINAKKVKANSDWISLIKDAINGTNSFNFSKILIQEADIQVITYKGDSTANFIRFVDLFDDGKPRDPKKPIFKMNTSIQVENSKLSIVNENLPELEGKWLLSENFQLDIPKLQVKGAEVDAQIKKISFKTPRMSRNYEMKKFAGNFSLREDSLSFRNLIFHTEKSYVAGRVAFHLDKKTRWQDFENRVVLDLDFEKGNYLSGYDLAYFMNRWDNFSPIFFDGKMKGTLNDFQLHHFNLGNEKTKIYAENIKMKKILAQPFDIKALGLSTDFTYKELKQMLPTFVVEKMKNFADDFGRIKYKGDLSLNEKQIVIEKAQLISGIGNADIERFSLVDFSSQMPKYQGFVKVKNLDTYQLSKMKQVGNVSGEFRFRGESFDLEKMKIHTQSRIDYIELLDKKIKNIHLDGLLNRKNYTGLVRVQDAFAKLNLKGIFDFSKPRLFADLKGKIDHLDLAHFIGGDSPHIIVAGHLDAKMAMTDLSDAELDGVFHQIRYQQGQKKYVLNEIKAKTFEKNGLREVEIQAPELAWVQMEGKFKLQELPEMIQNGVQKILVGAEPRKFFKNQFFKAKIGVNQNLLDKFLPELKITPQEMNLRAEYIGSTNDFLLETYLQKMVYTLAQDKKKNKKVVETLQKATDENLLEQNSNQIIAENIALSINTAQEDEQLSLLVDRVEYGNQIFKNISLHGENENHQKLHLSANFLMGTRLEERQDALKHYSINLNQTTDKNRNFVFRFNHTQLKFNNVVWNLDSSEHLDQYLLYNKKTGQISMKNIRVYSDDSSIMVNEGWFKSGEDFRLNGKVENFQIAKLFEMLPNGNSMDFQGLANGEFSLIKNPKALEPIISINIEDMKMGGREMGSLKINAEKTDMPNIFKVESRIVSAGILGGNKLHLEGLIDNNPQEPTMDISVNLNDFDLGFSQQFVSAVFSNMRGKANGTVRISGPMNDIDYSGELTLSQMGFKMNFTGVDYTFDTATIPFSKGFVSLNDIKIKDGSKNVGGSISGFIQFETLENMGVNLIMRAENLMVLNTKQKDNDLFWGMVRGKGDLYISGPLTSLDISTPNMRALNNSIFTFNSASSTGVEEFKMLRFLTKDKEGLVVVEEKKKTGANMNIDFNVGVDKGTTVNVLVGDDAGNISVQGASEGIRFRMARNGAVNLDGVYSVDRGTFTSKTILERTFQIGKGSSISWTGNPMTPELNISAKYSKMVSNMGQYLGTTLPQVNVVLGIDITGTMNKPELKFNISAPDVSSQIKETLASKTANEDEKIIQFGSILALSSFNVSGSGGFGINTGAMAGSVGYGLLLKQLSSVLNTLSNQVQVDFDYTEGSVSSNTSDRISTNANFRISPKIKMKTGLGIPLSASQSANNYFSGEWSMEYEKSNNMIFRIYSKPSNIGLVAGGNQYANQAYGAGVTYSKSFNRWFNKKNKDSLHLNMKNKKDTAQNNTNK